jgi:hypothetical protein
MKEITARMDELTAIIESSQAELEQVGIEMRAVILKEVIAGEKETEAMIKADGSSSKNVKRLNALINDYCKEHRVASVVAWWMIRNEFRYRYQIDLDAKAREFNESMTVNDIEKNALAVAKDLKMVPELVNVAYDLFVVSVQ